MAEEGYLVRKEDFTCGLCGNPYFSMECPHAVGNLSQAHIDQQLKLIEQGPDCAPYRSNPPPHIPQLVTVLDSEQVRDILCESRKPIDAAEVGPWVREKPDPPRVIETTIVYELAEPILVTRCVITGFKPEKKHKKKGKRSRRRSWK